MNTPDRDLLQQWSEQGDAEAFHELTVRYGGMVFATSMRIVGNTADAEDVTQECFEKLLRTQKNPVGYLGPWLHRVAINCALHRIRGEKRRKAREDKFAAQTPADVTVEWDDIYDLVDEAIDELPEELRVPVVQCFLENQTHAAIAESLGTSRSTVSYRITKALARIQASLKRQGVSIPTVLLGTLLADHAMAAVPATLAKSLGKLALASGNSTTQAAGVVATSTFFWGKSALVALGIVVLPLTGIWVALHDTDVGGERAVETAIRDQGESDVLPGSNGSQPPATADVVEDVGQNNSTSTVSGTVVDVGTNAPLANLSIEFERGNPKQHFAATTNEKGFFNVRSLEEGHYFVKIDDPYYLLDKPVHFEVLENRENIELTMAAIRGGSIRGRAFEKFTGRPIANLEIMVDPADGNPNMMSSDESVVTDASGAFRIGGLREGMYNIFFSSNYTKLDSIGDVDYEVRLHGQMKIQKVSVKSGETVEGLDFEPYLGSTISGNVINSKGDRAEGIEVWAGDGLLSQRSRTRPDGTFTIRGIRPTSNLQLYAAGGGGASSILGPLTLTDDGLHDVSITLAPAATVQGVIKDSHGRPLKGAYVEARLKSHERSVFGAQRAQSEDDGTFEIENLSAGEYVLQAVSQEQMESHEIGRRKELSTVSVVAGQSIRNVQLTLDEREPEPAGPLTIAGRVTDSSGKPLANVHVYSRVGQTSETAQSDEKGFYKLEGLAEGEYQLSLTHPEYTRGELQNVVAGTANANVVLENKVRITGQVVAADTGVPIPEFEVFHSRTNWKNIDTDSDEYVRINDEEGRFEFDDVEVGPLAVVVRAEGYPDQKAFSEVVRGQEHAPLRIEMLRGGRAIGRVITSEGQPVSGALLFIGKVPDVRDADFEKKIAARSGDDGRFQIEDVPLDAKHVGAMHVEYAIGGLDYEAGMTDIEIVLQTGGELEGIVTIAGKPASLVEVAAIHLAPHQNRRARTGEDGRFQIDNLLPGEHQVSATLRTEAGGHGQSRTITSTASIASGTNTSIALDFPLADAVVQGNVRSELPLPLSIFMTATYQAAEGNEMLFTEVDANGRYEFQAVPVGTITLSFSLPTSGGNGARMVVVPVTTHAGEIVNQDIVIHPGVSVSGTVVGVAPGRIAYVMALPEVRDIAWLELQDIVLLLREAVAVSRVNDDKTFYLEGLRPGTYTLFTYVMNMNDTKPNIESQATKVIEIGDEPEISVSIQL